VTAIVGLVHEGRVWIGGDSAAVGQWISTARADSKVFTNGPAVFGFTHSFRSGQLLRYSLSVPEAIVGDVGKYMATTFIDSVRECWKAGGCARRESEQEVGGCFLVGMFGRLFVVESDYQVGEQIEPWHAVGCGAEIALGSLWSTAHVAGLRDQPEARVRLALQAAANYSTGVRAPFTIIATEKQR
jgi:hypothetical protein